MFLKCFGFGDRNSSVRGYPTVIEDLCRPFSLSDIKKATNNFDQNRRIRDEGFYSVYKGCLQNNDGSDYAVAVKQFYTWKMLKNEIELLCQLRHPNIISLIGFCIHKKEKIGVFEHMSNGYLDQHLQALSWKKRLEICIGVARGLHYLHAGAKRTIIHCNIKSKTIVLDDNMHPKLTDFGVSIQGARFMSKPKTIKVDYLPGSIGYLVPEFFRDNTVTDKYDVFSFGAVLLEVMWGRTLYDIARGGFQEKPVEENIDVNIKGKIAPECWQVFIDITLRCVKHDADERPTMGEVEVELEHALSLQEQADITNTDADYTLLSTTIIPWEDGLGGNFHIVDTDSEESIVSVGD